MCGPVQKLGEQASKEVKLLLRDHSATDYTSVPTITHVPNDLAARVALELLRICEANQRRTEEIP